MSKNSCWGYEDNCKPENSFSIPNCPGDHKGWVATKKAQVDTFYTQGDFGYIRDQKKEMSLLCEPLFIASISKKKKQRINLYFFCSILKSTIES